MDETGDDEIHRMIRKTLDIGQPRAKKLREAGPEVEIMQLHPGQSFGQAALINEKPRYYSAICSENCTLLSLSKNDYFGLEGTQEKQINEKMDFLRTLQIFKTWSRVALYNVTFYFKEIRFRRGALVYSEGDPANSVYIIKEGEFKFTQKFSVQTGNSLLVSGKNSNKSYKNSTFRAKDLQIVTRQPGELFGIEELLDKSPSRWFSCTCLSQTGKLFVISEKNFFKKITHPESIKFYEEQWKTFKAWVDPRLEQLKELEVFKDGTSFTPVQKLKVVNRASTSNVGERLRNFSEVSDENTPLPLIIKKIMVNRNQSAWNSTRKRQTGSMFTTEFLEDEDSARFNFSSGFSDVKEMVFQPAKLIRGRIRKLK
jgi:CRP-like cAMP-binding protein